MFGCMLVFLALWSIVPEVQDKARLESARDRLNDAILKKKKGIISLRNMQQDFTSDHEFVEYILHQNRRVWENETVFVFED
jgi:hypothetical protein